MTRALFALVSRDLKLATRIGGGFSLGLVFYLSLVAILPFAVGPDSTSWRASARPFCGSERFLRR